MTDKTLVFGVGNAKLETGRGYFLVACLDTLALSLINAVALRIGLRAR